MTRRRCALLAFGVCLASAAGILACGIHYGRQSGFWFTPYRFWAEPRDGLGSVTCVDR